MYIYIHVHVLVYVHVYVHVFMHAYVYVYYVYIHYVYIYNVSYSGLLVVLQSTLVHPFYIDVVLMLSILQYTLTKRVLDIYNNNILLISPWTACPPFSKPHFRGHFLN